MMEKIGAVHSIWRYPIKGMAGERVESAEITASGITGDRLMAVQDVARNEIQSCKFRPQLLQCKSAYTDAGNIASPIKVSFPDGETLTVTAPEINQKISDLLGHESLLQEVRPASDRAFYRRHKKDEHTWLDELKATFAREPGEPLPDLDNLPAEAQEFVSLRGSFFLVSPLHIISTASIAHLRQLNPDANWDLERFRPNLVVETLPGSAGLIEQDWIGQRIKIGDITIQCSEPAPRCGAVSQQQQSIDRDTSVLRTIVKEADQNLGIYGDLKHPGRINAGDEIYLTKD